jgi:outer membrane lipoprotein-sorting protein
MHRGKSRSWKLALAASLAAAVLACAAALPEPALAQQMSLPAVAPLPPIPPLPREQAPAQDQTQQPAELTGKDRALASNGSPSETIERLNAYFNSLTTLVGNFVQVAPDGTRSQGQFQLQKPGRVRFDYDPPSQVQLIADGLSVAVRDRKLATQDLYPLSQTPLRFLLAKELDLAKDTNVVGVYEDDIFVTVVIEEKHPVVGTHRLMIMFGAEDTQLKQWTVTDPQGFDTTIAVFDLDVEQKPDPKLFLIDYQRPIQ